MGEKRKHENGAHDDVNDDMRHKVRSLERKHQQEAVLAGEDGPDTLFWSKKVEQDIKRGAGAASIDSRELAREREHELQRVRARREQVERERAERQEGLGDLERMRLAADAIKEAAKEEEFHLRQSIERARKRLSEARPHAVDELVRALHLQASLPVHDPRWRPYDVLDGMRVAAVQALLDEVVIFKSIDAEPEEHAQFWHALVQLMQQHIDSEVAAERADRAAAASGAPAAATAKGASQPPEVEAMVDEALSGGHDELLQLEELVDAELASPACPDPQFWAALKPKIARRKCETTIERIYLAKRAAAAAPATAALPPPPPRTSGAGAVPATVGPQLPPGADDSDDGLPEWMQQSDGRFSPEPVAAAAVPDGVAVVDEAEDREALMVLRSQVRDETDAAAPIVAPASAAAAPAADETNDDAAVRAARASLGVAADEAEFQGVVPLEAQEYWWKEKHKPRKPKFFNKVHTGYDWNKYNRAHYDVDNPPPKVVQGYKFNIFYPDLIDKSKAPKYRVLPDPSGDDSTKLLLFTAGPPYEDIAFRIVNKEWDRGPRKGFKNVFDRGILQLYFNHKRTPYKR